MRSGRPQGPPLRRWRIAAGVWAVLVFAVSSWPNPPDSAEMGVDIPGLDKVVHLVLYGVQGFLVWRAILWPGEGRRVSLMRALAVAGSLAVMGTVDEIHQLWIPGRGMEGADLLADVTGGAVGAGLSGLARRRSGMEATAEG